MALTDYVTDPFSSSAQLTYSHRAVTYAIIVLLFTIIAFSVTIASYSQSLKRYVGVEGAQNMAGWLANATQGGRGGMIRTTEGGSDAIVNAGDGQDFAGNRVATGFHRGTEGFSPYGGRQDQVGFNAVDVGDVSNAAAEAAYNTSIMLENKRIKQQAALRTSPNLTSTDIDASDAFNERYVERAHNMDLSQQSHFAKSVHGVQNAGGQLRAGLQFSG